MILFWIRKITNPKIQRNHTYLGWRNRTVESGDRNYSVGLIAVLVSNWVGEFHLGNMDSNIKKTESSSPLRESLVKLLILFVKRSC